LQCSKHMTVCLKETQCYMIGERISCGMDVLVWIIILRRRVNEGGTVWRDRKVRLNDCIQARRARECTTYIFLSSCSSLELNKPGSCLW
jgi:hypothetical protein